MKRKHWVQGGLLGFIGFLLSPLSWWNDTFINIPLAVGFGWIVAAIYKPAFQPGVVFGYWLSNLAGLVLMHKGVHRIVQGEQPKRYTGRDLSRDVLISLAYTGVIVFLLRVKLLQPIQDYLNK